MSRGKVLYFIKNCFLLDEPGSGIVYLQKKEHLGALSPFPGAHYLLRLSRVATHDALSLVFFTD